MSDELSLAQKLEMVRTALPKGLSAGDGGLGGLNSKPPQQSAPWPQFTTSTSESKVYTTNQAIETPAQNAQSSLFPSGYPFELSTVNEGTSEAPDWRVRVMPSTLAGGSSTDLGFAVGDNPPYLLTAEEGILQGGITIDSTGEITSRYLEIVPELIADTNTEFHVEIGTVQEAEDGGFDVTNSRYGPIDANVCRDWFSNPPTYSVTFFEGVQ